MLYYERGTGRTIDRIVEYKKKINFNDEEDDENGNKDFYSFENEKGNGILINKDNNDNDNGNGEKKKEYVMCVDKCTCYLECEKDDDCGDEEKCIEYQCDDGGNGDGMKKKRRETIGRNDIVDRKFASVIALPISLGICTFGVFSSVIIAKNYAAKYFSEKCKESCPTDNVEVEDSSIELNDVPKQYHCTGTCTGDVERWEKEYIQARQSQLRNCLNLGILMWKIDPVDITEMFDRELEVHEGYLKEHNIENLYTQCSSFKLSHKIISADIAAAQQEFIVRSGIECEAEGDIKWEMTYDDSLSYQGMLDFGILKGVCVVDKESVNCV